MMSPMPSETPAEAPTEPGDDVGGGDGSGGAGSDSTTTARGASLICCTVDADGSEGGRGGEGATHRHSSVLVQSPLAFGAVLSTSVLLYWTWQCIGCQGSSTAVAELYENPSDAAAATHSAMLVTVPAAAVSQRPLVTST